jgi:hypothetical protein
MTEKVKVSREVAEAIEYLLNHEHYGYTKEKLLLTHAEMERFPKRTWADNSALNNVELLDLAAMIVNGYEVEQTPEEIIKEKYEELFDYEPIDRACKDSFRFILDTLGIKIKGVND